ncbi:ribosome maturation factor RimM [Bartonella schoenbuchensis]|uniref:Ribosome maturation factor RimM n=1 Tax=Bartonella schoenbuchensis m07a TaxID=1094496 RepID=N6VBP5_9HYPH|nr:ribosome maturation factor RimM [Bartonella schoenbuchensis]ENN90696.1 16S rRNA processing protein RimM [Bartonella schoenbuchensis m07a]
MKQKRKKLKKAICLAIIGAAHGIRGDVWVKVLGGEPQRLKAYGVLYDEGGRCYEIATFRVQKNDAIVRFKGVEERSAAEALRGINLYIKRDQLLDDLAEDEFYQIDLIGLCVYDDTNKLLGEVSGFFNFGAGDLLEICLDGGKRELIPFSKAAVPEICVASGFIVINPVAAGLAYMKEE